MSAIGDVVAIILRAAQEAFNQLEHAEERAQAAALVESEMRRARVEAEAQALLDARRRSAENPRRSPSGMLPAYKPEENK